MAGIDGIDGMAGIDGIEAFPSQPLALPNHPLQNNNKIKANISGGPWSLAIE